MIRLGEERVRFDKTEHPNPRVVWVAEHLELARVEIGEFEEAVRSAALIAAIVAWEAHRDNEGLELQDPGVTVSTVAKRLRRYVRSFIGEVAPVLLEKSFEHDPEEVWSEFQKRALAGRWRRGRPRIAEQVEYEYLVEYERLKDDGWRRGIAEEARHRVGERYGIQAETVKKNVERARSRRRRSNPGTKTH